MQTYLRIALTALAVLMAPAVWAQGAQVAFGGLKQDPTLPVEITADQLQVDQADGSATFNGNVLIGQGEMRLSAAKVRVEYDEDGGEIKRLIASGGVTLATTGEAAEAQNAEYEIATGMVTMTGAVILTQGQNALSSERLVVNLTNGTGTMDGRVRTVLQPGKK